MTDDYHVPDGAEVYECRYCGHPYAREELLALHRGLDHPAELGDEEIEAFRAAHDAEKSELGAFRLRALGALVVIYFFLLMIYALV
ncbi:C2H2-type zinc finger protein [Haloarcula laminariae]|uniref:C2H2-type zinc finger protein n=1 Tax=Haloarcula laminariae TaxID=2961577 RepID=UPI0021C5C0F1|nr:MULTISPECIES: C2H2-type zinc finger protein [Halomicroarcula]